MLKTVQHRPAVKRRRFRHDDLIAVDLFSGFGGLTQGIKMAGFTTIACANHNEYKVQVHEANHPEAEHWIADLVDTDSPAYHSAADLPAADLLVAGVSCVNHSPANTRKAYALGLSLFDMDDSDYEDRVTRSERDRATATCVLQYAAKHHPRMILIECTTQLFSWGYLVPGKKKVGDGTTYQWWLGEFGKLGYKHRVLYFNSMFFGPGQSRDRGYWVFWDESIPDPDLDHKPITWCGHCQQAVEAVWTWKTGIPPTGTVCYGKQYNYRCPRCRREIVPQYTPSLDALDLTNLGTRIGDRKRPLATATMARAERCRQRFGEFPAVLMPAKMLRGAERHPWQPLPTQTSQQEMALLSTAAIMQMANSFEHPGSQCRTRDLADPLWSQLSTSSTGMLAPPVAVTGNTMAAHRHNGDGKHISEAMDTVTSTHERAVLLGVTNFQGAARGADEPLPTQGGSETLSILSTGVMPYRKNTTPATAAEAMPTVTSEQIPGLLTAAGVVQFNQGVDRRTHGVDQPFKTMVADNHMGLLFSGWYKSNGSAGNETAPHPVLDPFNTFTAHDTTTLLTAEWHNALANLALEDCYFRMLSAREIGRGCGFDVDWGGRKGSFIVWGSERDQVDGYGNAVTPQVGEWIGLRLRAALHGEQVAA
jgi:site-specific DNA-cytosine methylase